MVILLRNEGAVNWANWMEKSCQEIASSDFYSIERLLRACGGIGPFNDQQVAEELDSLQT